MNKLWLLGIFLIMIPLVNALVVTSPINNTSTARFLQVNWTNSTGTNVQYYNVTLTNSTNGTIPIFLGGLDVDLRNNTLITGVTCSVDTIIKSLTFNRNSINNVSFNLSMGTANGTLEYYVQFIYSDGTSLNTTWQNVTFVGVAYTKLFVTNPDQNRLVTTVNVVVNRVSSYSCNAQELIAYPIFNTHVADLSNYNLSIGNYRVNVTAFNSSNISLDHNNSGLFTLTANALLNVTALNLAGSIVPATFTLSSTSQTGTPTTLFNVVRGSTYTLVTDNTSFSLNSTSVTISNFGTTAQNITLLPNNAVNISIFREDNGSLAYGSALLTFVGDSGGVFYGSANQTNTTANLAPDNYTMAVSLGTFDTRYYYINVVNRTFQNLNIYMLNGTTTAFNFKAPSSAIIPGGLLRVYKYISGVLTLVESKVSDVTGTANVLLDPSLAYFFIASADSYNNYSFGLNPISETSYDITLESSSADLTYLPLPNITGSVSYNNNTHILTFNYISTESNVTTYFYTVSKIINATPVIICSGTNTTLTKTFTCNTTGYNGAVFVQGVADDYIFYGLYHDLGNSGLDDIINQRDAGFFSGFIILLLVLGCSVFGIVGVVIAAIGGMIIIYWLGLLTPLTLTMIIVGVVGSLIIVLGIKRR